MNEPLAILNLRSSTGNLGGAETYIFNNAPLIDQRRFTYLVASLHKPDHDLASVAALAQKTGVQFFDIPGRSYFDLGQLRAIVRIIRTRKVRVLHSHDYKCDFLSSLLGLLFPRLGRVSTVHGWVVRPDSLKSACYVRLDKFLLPRFHAAIAVSRVIGAELTRHGAKNVHVLHNAIDVDAWRPASGMQDAGARRRSAGEFTVGFIGRLSAEKGPLDFLDVARAVLDTAPEARFVMAGHGPEAEAVARRIEALSLADRVRVLGQLDVPAIRELYGRLDCLLSPSHTEGMPMSLLEAMAMQTPVVATAVGGVGELIEHGESGLLCEKGDIKGMCAAVLEVKQRPELSQKLSLGGRERVIAHFSIQDNIKEIMTIYTALASRGART